jgi:branched-chain amino acid transport system substrate-binding protein
LTDDEVNGIYSILDTVPDQNPDPKVQEWIKNFKAKFKLDAGPYAAEYYDGTMILLNAIKAVGSDSEALLKALRATTEYKGIANTYTSDKYGNATHSVVTVQFNKKAVKVLSTVSMQPER